MGSEMCIRDSCSAKAGLIMLTRALALELGPEVRVNAVAPGIALWPEGDGDAQARERAEQLVPLSRPGSAEEVADAVTWLALDASYTTGEVIAVDGGGNFAGELQVAPQDTPFVPGTWVHVRITYDFNVGNNEQSVHVYFDDVEPPYVSTPMGPANMPGPTPTEHVWIGAWDTNDQETAAGVLDEFAIYDQVLAP